MENKIEIWNDIIQRDVWIRNKRESEVFLASLPSVRSISSSLPIPYKYAGTYALIPSNWDYDRHIAEYPLTNYLFVETPNGKIKSINRNGVEQSYFDKDRLIYLVGLISSIPAKNKDSITEDGFVLINSKLLRSFFKDYLSYLDYLLQTNVLITDGEYIAGVKSLGYRFSEQYNDATLIDYQYNNVQTQERSGINQEIYDDESGSFITNTVLDFPYLHYWYSTNKLAIQKDEAVEFANIERQRKLALGREYWDINRDLSTTNKVVYKNPTTQYNAAIHNITALDLGQYNVQIDSNVHRLHSVITNIQKSYRRYLRYENNPIVGIDISNSQPYILCLLFNPQFWDNRSDNGITLWHLPYNIQQYFNYAKIEEIIEYLSTVSEQGLNDYKAMASQGLIYEYMKDKINSGGYSLSRDDVKTMMMTVLFSDNRYMPILKKLFRENFPAIYGLIKIIKKGNHRSLPCLLQSIESEIILHRCCKRIWEECNHEIPVFTIHDSICTIPQYIEEVSLIMNYELENAIGLPPHLKIENWLNP